MIKSSRELVFDEIVKDNFVSNQDIMDRTGLNEDVVKTNVYSLKVGREIRLLIEKL